MAENLTFNVNVDNSNAVDSINRFFDTVDSGATRAKNKLNKAFNQKFETAVKVEFKNGELVAKQIQKVGQESKRLETIHKAVNGQLGKTPNQLKKQQAAIKGLIGDTKKFKDGTNEVTKEWKTLNERVKLINKEMKRFGQQGNFLESIGAKFIGLQTAANLATTGVFKMIAAIGDLANTAMRMETLQLQLEGFTGGAAEASAAFDEFVRIAGNSPFNLEQVASAAKIMMAFGVDTDKSIKATEQLGIVAAATGGDINLMARNLGQISAQGRAYTRDLTQFAIQGVPIWQQLSIVTGESTSALKQMATEGRITGVEVAAAFANMTKEGSDYQKIAVRMQETFQGRFAKIEASFQKLALEAVNALNQTDKAFGGLISGSMKLFSDFLMSISDNIQAVTIALASLVAGLATFTAAMVLMNLGAIATGIKKIIIAVKAWIAAKKILSVVTTFLAGLTGGYAAIALATAAAAGAALFLANQSKGLNEDLEDVDETSNKAAASVGSLTDSVKKQLRMGGNQKLIENFEKIREEADNAKTAMELGVDALKAQKRASDKRYKDEQNDIQEIIDKKSEAIQIENDSYQKAKTALKDRYSQEKSDLDAILAKVRERYDLEIGDLQKKGRAEQALYNFQKNELKNKIASRSLDREAQLQAEARLERMERIEKIEKLRLEQKREEESLDIQKQNLLGEEKADLDTITKKYEEKIRLLESQKKKEEEGLKKSKRLQKEINEEIKETIDSANGVTRAVYEGDAALRTQIGSVNNLITKYQNLETAARKAAIAANNQARADNNAGANTSGVDNRPRRGFFDPLFGPGSERFRFAGGPVSGGGNYTVNELGKEAFLSASGRLSMINAPSFGKWKAPSKGTVIPAHLTKQLNVPSGGVNVNRAAVNSTSSAAGGMNFNKLASAILNSVSGDNVTNNVTIQADNTTQTASDIMVQLAKIKRLRYN